MKKIAQRLAAYNIKNVYLRRLHLLTVTPILVLIIVIVAIIVLLYEAAKNFIYEFKNFTNFVELKELFINLKQMWRKDYKL